MSLSSKVPDTVFKGCLVKTGQGRCADRPSEYDKAVVAAIAEASGLIDVDLSSRMADTSQPSQPEEAASPARPRGGENEAVAAASAFAST